MQVGDRYVIREVVNTHDFGPREVLAKDLITHGASEKFVRFVLDIGKTTGLPSRDLLMEYRAKHSVIFHRNRYAETVQREELHVEQRRFIERVREIYSTRTSGSALLVVDAPGGVGKTVAVKSVFDYFRGQSRIVVVVGVSH